MSEKRKAFAKFDRMGEGHAHRVISGAVRVPPTEHAYALLWLAERGKNRTAETERRPTSETDEGPDIAKFAANAQYLAAMAALHSAKSHERALRSARYVTFLALGAIGVSIFALVSEGHKDTTTIQQTAASAVQAVAEILGQI